MNMLWIVFVLVFFLIQAPLMVDLMRHVYPKRHISRLTSRTANAVLISVVTFLGVGALCYQLFLFLPLVVGGNPLHSYRGLAHLAVSLWIWVNGVVYYYASVFVHPGSVDVRPQTDSSSDATPAGVRTEAGKSSRKDGPNSPHFSAVPSSSEQPPHENSTISAAVRMEAGMSSTTNGETVSPLSSRVPSSGEKPRNGMEWQPYRHHHCKVCRTTSPYMDHHCPFTGNCVSLHNYAYFYVGLIYLLLGLIYSTYILLPFFWRCTVRDWLPWSDESDGGDDSDSVCERAGPHSILAVTVSSGVWVTWNFLLIQTLLLLADLSTHDILKNVNDLPVFRYALDRIRGLKCLHADSRLRVLILNQRPNPLYYLLPLPGRRHADKEHCH